MNTITTVAILQFVEQDSTNSHGIKIQKQSMYRLLELWDELDAADEWVRRAGNTKIHITASRNHSKDSTWRMVYRKTQQ